MKLICGFHYCAPFNQNKEEKKIPGVIEWNVSVRAETNMIMANYY
jgi:hypothetical protein